MSVNKDAQCLLAPGCIRVPYVPPDIVANARTYDKLSPDPLQIVWKMTSNIVGERASRRKHGVSEIHKTLVNSTLPNGFDSVNSKFIAQCFALPA